MRKTIVTIVRSTSILLIMIFTIVILGVKIPIPIVLAATPTSQLEQKDPSLVDSKIQSVATKTAEVEKKKTVKISAVGDCTLGFYKGQDEWNRFDKVAQKNGLDYFMKNVKPIFEKDDLTIINLEGPLTQAPYGMEKEFVMRGKTDYIKILTGSSIEAANLANNHTYDCGSKGYQETQKLLTSNNIGAFGEKQIFYKDINDVKVALIGYKVWDANKTTKQALKNLITEAKKQAQLVIVMFHWGQENVYEPNAIQKEIGKFVIDCGADLVLGSHPHVIQGIEKYKGKNIVYSMGNFCFGGNRNPKDKDTFIFQETFELVDNKIVSVESNVIPCWISSSKDKNNYQPIKAIDDDRILEKLKKHSKYFKISYFN